MPKTKNQQRRPKVGSSGCSPTWVVIDNRLSQGTAELINCYFGEQAALRGFVPNPGSPKPQIPHELHLAVTSEGWEILKQRHPDKYRLWGHWEND